jgi:hypothetical protein
MHLSFYIPTPIEKIALRSGTRPLARCASHLLSSLGDFGLLQGTQIRTIQRPVIALETVYHLLVILWAEGNRGRAILQSPDWHIFLWQEIDVVNALSDLAQRGWVQFEKAGQTVMLDLIRMPEVTRDDTG